MMSSKRLWGRTTGDSFVESPSVKPGAEIWLKVCSWPLPAQPLFLTTRKLPERKDKILGVQDEIAITT